MIFGPCPHCGKYVATTIGEALSVSFERCDNCGESYWLKHSRIAPEAYTERPKGLVRKADAAISTAHDEGEEGVGK